MIAAGNFNGAGGQSAHRIAAWNGASWRPLGTGLDGQVRTLVRYEKDLIAGDEFNAAGGQGARGSDIETARKTCPDKDRLPLQDPRRLEVHPYCDCRGRFLPRD